MANTSSHQEKAVGSLPVQHKYHQLWCKRGPTSRSADLVNVHYGGDKVRPRAKRHKCFSPPSEDAQPVGPTEHRPRGRRSGSEDRAFALGPCEELFGLLLLASVPLPRGRTQPSARARLMNQSEVSRSSVLPAMSSLTVST